MYEKTDKTISYLNKKLIKSFSKARSLLSYDELNVFTLVNGIYADIFSYLENSFLLLAKNTYEEHGGYLEYRITMDWLKSFLQSYDPVTKYVFQSEVDRKRSRFTESLIASSTKNKEVDVALRYMSRMMKQAADEITDLALLEAYRDTGVKKVKWVTEKDTKVCETCRNLEGKVFDIDNVPTKPHMNCRCYIIPEG